MIAIIDPIQYAHKLSQLSTSHVIQDLYSQFPELRQEMEYNTIKYGTPILHSGKGGLWLEDIPQEVQRVIADSQYPVEIRIRPSDPDGHHYELDWFVLTYNEAQGRLRRAIDVERERWNGDGTSRK